jgi:hypothetical protein
VRLRPCGQGSNRPPLLKRLVPARALEIEMLLARARRAGHPSTGHKAKAALILRVASDPRLMELTRREAGQQPEPLAGILRDVVAAANGSKR